MSKGFTDKSARGLNRAVAHSHGQVAAKAARAGETTREYAEQKAHAPGKLGKQARLALILMGFHHAVASGS